MRKLKLGVMLGGMSTEHDVSISSGVSVLQNLNKDKYDIYPIYIAKDGIWYEYSLTKTEKKTIKVGEQIAYGKQIKNEIEYLKQLDVVFPVLHGLYGEDGSMQGLLELAKIPYVGCHIIGSCLGMDKVYSKIIFEKAKIKQADYCYIRKDKEKYRYIEKDFTEKVYTLEEVTEKIVDKLNFPMFIKPSNSGSSVGISKAKNEEELKKAIITAEEYDKKLLIEEEINGREVECAVLGNEEVIASCIGEIIPAEEFYDYKSKYQNTASRVLIPADITKEKEEEIQKTAIKAYKALDGKGLSRVDFFIDRETEEVYINEINTMPGFTEISMYPKLLGEIGIPYSTLLDKLIELATEK